jgi:sec-independent protein translocase protein TatB
MLSIPHLIIIFVIVLIAVGPEKMPQLARTLGKAMAEFRKITGDLRRVVDDEMRELDRQTREAEIRKRDASAQSSLPGTSTPAVQMLGTPLPDEHVIAPPVDADSSSIAEPQPAHSIAPPGTIATAPPNARSAEVDAADAPSEPAHEDPPSDAESKPA